MDPDTVHQQEPTSLQSSGIGSENGTVISKLEAIFATLKEDTISGKNEIRVPFKSRASRAGNAMANSQDVTRPTNTSGKLSFPGSTAQEAWRFTVVIRLLSIVHEALVNNVIVSKRDIYYQDPGLFLNQTVVDRYIDDMAFTFGVRRASLNVVATAKGLVAGSFIIKRFDGTVLDVASVPEGILIPKVQDIASLDITNVDWILVIEKEAIQLFHLPKNPTTSLTIHQATFRSLASTRIYRNRLIGSGIILTAKGYPDILTRSFLSLLSLLPNVPTIYALMDYDPDGLAILSTYTHGSQSLAHESSFLTLPSIRWLGIKSRELGFPFLQMGGESTGLLRLTKRDRRKATLMLENSVSEKEEEKGNENENGKAEAKAERVEQKRELQVMLILNIKAEIQILNRRSGGLDAWLEERLLSLQ